MGVLMARIPRQAIFITLGFALAAAVLPDPAHAQLVREAAPAQQDSSKTPAPSAKVRVSQEVQLAGDQSWVDTGIDVQPGEHVVVTATGKLRFGDAKEDNGPDGLARGFRDLLRVLPFNDAGRGALIGRIGDKDIAQPFLVGGHRDVVAPSPGGSRPEFNRRTTNPAGAPMVGGWKSMPRMAGKGVKALNRVRLSPDSIKRRSA